MKKLNIDFFISAAADSEYCQYVFLAELKKTESSLHANRVYPALSSLIELKDSLQAIAGKKTEIEGLFPKKLSGFDIINGKAVYESSPPTGGSIDSVFEFINWALPRIGQAVEEGKAIYRFVKENLTIEEVGLVPLYKNEGYFFIPDYQADSTNIYRYEIPFIAAGAISDELVRLDMVKQINNQEMISRSLRDIKLELIRENPGLPNPAAYSFITDLDFSFSDTVLPIAKRRLLKKLVN